MDQVAHAIEVSFDPAADTVVRATWHALDDAGIPSLNQIGDSFRPHLSLSVFTGGRSEAVAEAVTTALIDHPLATVRLSHVGAFLAPRRVLFCGITPTLELMACHEAVDAAIRAGGGTPWPIYSPTTWVPHCTLAMDLVGDLGQLSVLGSLGLPLDAGVRQIRLVEVPTGAEVADVTPHVQT